MALRRFGWKLATGSLSLLLLLGCTVADLPYPKKTTGRAPTVAEVPEEDETVRGADEPPIVTLDIGSQFRDRRLSKTDDLPGNVIVPNTNLNAVPVTTALQAVLAGTDVSLSWEAGSFDSRLVTVTNLSGPLPRVVEKICASAKVFCSHRNGLLEMKERETFVIDLPATINKASAGTSATNTMADTISDLAGEKARIDQQGGNLIYTTDVQGQERVLEYIAQLRNGRPLVVMQLYIWEVILDSDNGAGINWTEFSMPSIGNTIENALVTGSTGFASLASPGVSLGATFAGQVDAKAVVQFLSTQGQVQTISNPQLTFVSGSSAEFRVGGKTRYISEVGTGTSSTSSSVSSSTSTSGSTISTDSLDTGLKVVINGSFESGVISASLELELEDVVSLNPTTTQGYTIDLPETSERKVTTSLRVRPGDNLVLAGLVSARDTNDREGLPLFGKTISSFKRDQYKNTELVILVKPAIVLFADKSSEREEKKAEKAKKKKALEGEMNAVLIDKNGSQTLKMPDTPVLEETSPPPELMVSEPSPMSLKNVPISRSEDGAPVDKRLFQRGFSHAYDELLEPITPGGKP